MFFKAAKSLAKELEPDGNFIPIRCPLDEKHFRPLCLVHRKRKSPWWQSNPYHKTEYRLHNILLSGDHTAAPINPINLDVQVSAPVTIVDQVDGKIQGQLGGPVDLATLLGITSMTQTRSVKVKKIHVSSRDLHSITEEWKVNMCHGLIRQSKKFRRNLYVITEAIETVKETQFEESRKTEGSIFSETYIKVKLNGASDSKKSIIIPRDCILAFRAKQLQIKDGSLEISDYQSNKTETFAKSTMQTDGAEVEVSRVKRNSLQREVREECMDLSHLSADLRGMFLSGFVATMRKNELLHELESQLEQALDSQSELKTDRPELQELVGNLQDSSGVLFTHLAESVLYLTEALNELTEFQLLLLAESVEKKIVSKQLLLVESILDNGSSNKEWKFAVDAQKLCEEDLNMTGAMIEMSGVTVQKIGTSLVGTGNCAALSSLSALYVALFAMNLLLAS